jgi:hypothetical protein
MQTETTAYGVRLGAADFVLLALLAFLLLWKLPRFVLATLRKSQRERLD